MRALMSGYRWAVAVAVSIGLGVVLVPVGAAHADATFEFRGDASSAGAGKRTASKSATGRKRATRQTSQRLSHKAGRSKRMSLGAADMRRPRESLTGGSRSISRSTSSRKMRFGRRDGYKASRVRTASLGNSYAPPAASASGSLAGGIRWGANSSCLNSRLRAVIAQLASTFGPVTVNSTCRGRRHNARVGGARHSHHLSGNAVDFRVHGRSLRAVLSFLRNHSSVGGLKLYRRGFFHIDTGARRSW